MRQIVLDTETTGLEVEAGHRIIEIGCIELIDRRITKNCFHEYINPQRSIDEGAQQVHGISAEFLADKPVFGDLEDAFLEFVKGAELVIHNAAFDLAFLNKELSLGSADPVTMEEICGVLDTLSMARSKYPGQRNSLDALCNRLGVDNSNREQHGALLDAELLAEVYLHLSGGQGKLVLDGSNTKARTHEQRLAPRSQQLRVILPTEKELEEHNSFLDDLNESSQSGCLWTELDS
ncbi:MAG: DNA polymerase III subunit epsilon [Gammaproteobacteria bacterium]|jgi:DNA polymerase III subunit epsilon|nr:DNA polymerase III subunit epsilon [Gammaproteobacteria bacterium]MBT5203707.1 DNA polymerase III subunit epsilon [Gammaproteobacteria bacterium]MBT5601698.1 DNA polymerase III subunit epsilon [Gammaproteobacteria bacterium]MBT6245239.1 DNA polymerase III subunit epsilon [Gammaproteobacteria bacterium]